MFRDRVKETSTSTGTADFTLSGAELGFRTFDAAFGTDPAYYVIVNLGNPAEWEIGSFTVSGTTLGRSAGNVLSGSSGTGTLVNFTAGKKSVFNAPPAAAMQNWIGSVNTSGSGFVSSISASSGTLNVNRTSHSHGVPSHSHNCNCDCRD